MTPEERLIKALYGQDDAVVKDETGGAPPVSVNWTHEPGFIELSQHTEGGGSDDGDLIIITRSQALQLAVLLTGLVP